MTTEAHRAKRRAYYAKNKARFRRIQRRYEKKHRAKIRAARKRYAAAHPKLLMLLQAKHRAKKRGLPFNLKQADFEIPLCCPVLNIPLRPGVKHSHDASPSLDRIKPELGYVRGNVAVISQRANTIKGFASALELFAVAYWLERQRG
jgi:hypothetical protein